MSAVGAPSGIGVAVDGELMAQSSLPMKRPTREERHRGCTRKRRYRSQGDALEAAMLAGVERLRTAYRCPECGQWHLATKPGRDRGTGSGFR